MNTTTTKAAAQLAPDSPDFCAYLSEDGKQQLICTQTEAEAFCDAYGIQIANVLSPGDFGNLERYLAITHHFAEGQLYRAFHGRPDGFSLDAKEEAAKLFAKLTPEEVAYAADPARGEYRGFAALHDLCDANMLLPGVDGGPDSLPANDEACLAFWNSVMDEVTRLILSGRPGSFASAEADALGGEYGDDHGPSDQVLTYFCEGFAGRDYGVRIVCTVSEMEEFERFTGTELEASDTLPRTQYDALLGWLHENAEAAA